MYEVQVYDAGGRLVSSFKTTDYALAYKRTVGLRRDLRKICDGYTVQLVRREGESK